MVQTMKFLIVEPSTLPICISLGLNIRLRFLLSNILILDSSLNVTDHASQPYSTTDSIVLYILILKFVERSLEDTCLD